MNSKWIELINSDDYVGIKKYLKSDGDISEENDAGEGVLSCAIRARCSFETLMLLVEYGADPFDFDNEGVSVFDIAITYDNREMVEYLIKHGRDVNQTNRKSGFTPLMAAACYGRSEIAKILIENGVNQDAIDAKGFSAADFARKMNKKSVLKVLNYDEDAPKNTNYAR